MKHSLFLATILAGSVGAAQAQQVSGSPQLSEVEDESTMVSAFNLSVDELEGMEIMSSSGEEFGDIDEILQNDQGEIEAVSAEVGGFLGIGEKEVVFQLDQLRKEGDHFVTDLTRDQLAELQTWTE